MTKHALIVEPYLSGGLLPVAFSRDGIASVGVHLRPMTHKIAATFRAEEFPSHIFGGDLTTRVDGRDWRIAKRRILNAPAAQL